MLSLLRRLLPLQQRNRLLRLELQLRSRGRPVVRPEVQSEPRAVLAVDKSWSPHRRSSE